MRDKYLMLEKMAEIEAQSQICGEFLEWIQTKYSMFKKDAPRDDLFVLVTSSDYINIEKVLAEFFNIDLATAEKERSLLFAKAGQPDPEDKIRIY